MQGVSGIVVRKKGDYRLVLNVDMLAQSAAVEVAETDLELIGPERRPPQPVDWKLHRSRAVPE
jgi:hypothetical protein